MATRIQVIESTYLRELVNGPSFNIDTGNNSNHLLGHVGDRQRVTFRVQVQNIFTMGRYDITGRDTITLVSGQNFLDEDFYEGQQAYLSFSGITDQNYQFTIDTISTDGTQIVAKNIVGKNDNGTNNGINLFNDGNYSTGASQDIMRGLGVSDGLITKFGFVGNNQNVSFISPYDNKVQEYRFNGLRPGGSPGPVVTGSWGADPITGSNTGSMTAQFIADVPDTGVYKTSVGGVASVAVINSIQEFEIVQEFIIPYYQQGEFDNVTDENAPDRLVNGLQHVLEFEFRQSLSNPNVSQFGQYNNVQGNVKYYANNYIETPQQYSVSDVVLTDLTTGQVVTNIDAASTTRVTFNINSANSTLLTADPVLAEHSYLPNGDKYSGRKDVYQNVWLYDTLRAEIDGAVANSSIITNFNVGLVSAAQASGQFDVSFSTQQQVEIQNGYNWELSIKVADSSLSVVNSDVTKLVIDTGQYTVNTDILGLADFPQSYFYSRPIQFPIVNPTDRFTSLHGWVQDGIMYDWTVGVNVDEQSTLESLTVRLVAFNTAQNTFFEFDSYDYDLSGQVITSGPPIVQNINVDDTRGYDLSDVDKLNYARANTDVYASPFQYYRGQTAFRLSWQDWIASPRANTVFFNSSEPNNGLNKNLSNYSLVNGYVICVLIDARISKEVDGVSVITQYINRSGNIQVLDFYEQDGTPITWTGQINTFDDQGTNLNGLLLSDDITTIEGCFTPDTPVTDISLYWGEIRLEPINNPGDGYSVLSTVQAGSDNNPLKAPAGSMFAKLELNGGNVKVIVDLDPSLLDNVGTFKPSARFGLIDQSVPPMPGTSKDVDLVFKFPYQNYVVGQQTEVMAQAEIIQPFFSSLDIDADIEYRVSSSLPADWSLITPLADFDAFKSHLDANSGDFYQILVTNPPQSPGILGLILRYRVLTLLGETQTLLYTWNFNDVDRTRITLFDTIVEFTNENISGAFENLFYSVNVLGASIDDYGITEYTNINDVNNFISTLTEGDKYTVSFIPQFTNSVTARTYQVDVEFLNDLDLNKELLLDFQTFSQARPFGNAFVTEFIPPSTSVFIEASPASSAVTDLFDNSIAPNEWSIELWGKDLKSGYFGNAEFFVGGGGGIRGLLCYILGLSSGRIDFVFGDQVLGQFIRIFFDLTQKLAEVDDITHLFFTYDGSRSASGVNLYVNGVLSGKSVQSDTLQPTTNTSGRTRFGIPTAFNIGADSTNPNNNSSIGNITGGSKFGGQFVIYDAEVTHENVMKRYLDPFTAIGDEFRVWDIEQISGTTIPETVANDDGQVINSLTPTVQNFYL